MAGAHDGSADRSRTDPREATCTRTAQAVKASTSGSTSACRQNLTGRKWYCRSTSARSGDDRVNRPASARFEVSGPRRARSEEHTSELQSRQYLVCRLLLEKKKIKRSQSHTS